MSGKRVITTGNKKLQMPVTLYSTELQPTLKVSAYDTALFEIDTGKFKK
ncbi:MAG TPA: hypothetical protein PLA68_04015 [Panacibacter sp.]|nr:hypothetical protein [Panacibacter sp.]